MGLRTVAFHMQFSSPIAAASKLPDIGGPVQEVAIQTDVDQQHVLGMETHLNDMN